MSNLCKPMLPPAPLDHADRADRTDRTDSTRPADRRVVATRLRRMGISITSLTTVQRASVRAWATTLTELEVESVVETVCTVEEKAVEVDEG